MDQTKSGKFCQTSLIYAAASVNRHPNCVDYLCGCLVFATSNCLAVYDVDCGRMNQFLKGHNDEISSVHFIREADELQNLIADQCKIGDGEPQGSLFLVSTSYDKTAIIWESKARHPTSFEILYKLESHEGPVLVAHSLQTRDGTTEERSILTVTSDIDGVTKIWINENLLDTITTKYMVIASRLAKFSKETAILCLGGSDDNIHLFQITPEHEHDKLHHLIDITGHADWIRSLDIVRPSPSQPVLMMASASQDSFIRIWRITLKGSGENSIREKVAQLDISPTAQGQQPLFISVILETVLAGHEGRVYGINWSRIVRRDTQDSPDVKIRLLSCSSDKSIIVWESLLSLAPSTSYIAVEDEKEVGTIESNITDDVWQELYRIGEAGEANLSFLGACLTPDSTTIYAYTLNGAIHSWISSSSDSNDKSISIQWIPSPTITGHFGAVTDIVWQNDGHYFMTSSLDKTCRAHGYVESRKNWSEVARPQVHGHEVNCITIIDNLRFASGAEEKTIRLFEATNSFIKTFQNLTSKNLLESESILDVSKLATHAEAPPLGLSNRPVSAKEELTEQNVRERHTDELCSALVEDVLLQSTLWPEIQKLYGHSYEIYSIAIDSKKAFLASASKANKSEFASIIIWDLSTFDKLSTLLHHSLTVTRLRYSPDNKYLLSVSRDRTWCLWKNDLAKNFCRAASTTKQTAKHERIIWDCSWTPDASYFVTVSRDRKAIAWNVDDVTSRQSDDHPVKPCRILTMDDSIQAVDILDRIIEKEKSGNEVISRTFLVAFGLEKGDIVISNLRANVNAAADVNVQWSICKIISKCHQLPIKRLAFRPTTPGLEEDSLLLGSVGDDGVVLLLQIN